MANTIDFVIDELNKKNVQLKRLLKQIFGIKSEKTKKVFNQENTPTDNTEES